MKRDLIDITDLSVEEIDDLISVAEDIIEHPDVYREKCRHKKLATLFYEPSTRTRLSFEAAMYELGGQVLGFSEATSSSAAKGESVADTARTVSCFADIIAMRHPKEGAPLVASMKATVPVINAGDGGHHHPTQTLTDLLTIKRRSTPSSGPCPGIATSASSSSPRRSSGCLRASGQTCWKSRASNTGRPPPWRRPCPSWTSST